MATVAPGFVATLKSAGSHVAEGARGVAGYVTHTAGRVGEATGATGAWKSIAESTAGQFVGRHKIAAGAVGVATVAAMAYNAGGNHRARLMQQQRSAELSR